MLEVQCGRFYDDVLCAIRLNAKPMCVDLTDRPTVQSHTSLQTELHGTQERLSLGSFHGTQFEIFVPKLSIMCFISTSFTLELDVVSARYRPIQNIKIIF